jgi:hypothetical protein
MRAFKNKWFNRWVRNEGITNMNTCTAAAAFIAATDKYLADLIARGGIFELECEKS